MQHIHFFPVFWGRHRQTGTLTISSYRHIVCSK